MSEGAISSMIYALHLKKEDHLPSFLVQQHQWSFSERLTVTGVWSMIFFIRVCPLYSPSFQRLTRLKVKVKWWKKSYLWLCFLLEWSWTLIVLVTCQVFILYSMNESSRSQEVCILLFNFCSDCWHQYVCVLLFLQAVQVLVTERCGDPVNQTG